RDGVRVALLSRARARGEKARDRLRRRAGPLLSLAPDVRVAARSTGVLPRAAGRRQSGRRARAPLARVRIRRALGARDGEVLDRFTRPRSVDVRSRAEVPRVPTPVLL